MIKRNIIDRVFNLREWQAEAFRALLAVYEKGERNFLAVATPGSGKTKFALKVAHYFLSEKICERVVVVTPTDNLKSQWAEEAANFAGIDIDPDFSNSMGCEAGDYHGIVITYALLGQDKKKVHAQSTFSRRTLVIFDEIHHAGESLSWGDAIKNSYENAVFRLAISGTAFRSDDALIPFIKYENRVSVSDYTYSYDRAIKENVCRPVYFTIHDGQMKWKVGSQEFDHNFKESLDPDQVSKRLRTALDPHGNWVKDVLRAANNKLSEIRASHPNAAAMVFAATQQHAKEIAKVVEQLTGKMPPIVISEDQEGNENIEKFKHSNERWLVSVKMVSEGVDIPRLRLGVYFTIVKTEMFFRQAVGRFVRVITGLHHQDAYIFIPQDKDIVKLAETIQMEREHALDEAERAKAGTGEPEMFGDYTPALKGKFTMLGSEATESKTIAVNVELTNGGAKFSIDHRKPFNELPVFQQKQLIRERLNLLAKKIALKNRNGNTNIKPDWKFAHKKWRESGGLEMEFETVEQLQRREDFYIKMLRG
jgi:superfamily II DNA or RNA helicase